MSCIGGFVNIGALFWFPVWGEVVHSCCFDLFSMPYLFFSCSVTCQTAVVIHHMTLIVMEVFYSWDQAMPAKFGAKWHASN